MKLSGKLSGNQLFWKPFYARREMNSHHQYLKPKSGEKQLKIVNTAAVKNMLLKLDSFNFTSTKIRLSLSQMFEMWNFSLTTGIPLPKMYKKYFSKLIF